MKKGLWIYLVILLLLAVGVDTLILRKRYLPPAFIQNFSTSINRHILVGGNTDMVNVTTASNGYYRIKSDGVFAEGEYITGNYFQNVIQLPIGQWDIIEEEGENISFTVISSTPIDVTLISNTNNFLITILLTLFLIGILFLFGWFIVVPF